MEMPIEKRVESLEAQLREQRTINTKLFDAFEILVNFVVQKVPDAAVNRG